jgi:hypothetical protein
MKKGKAKRLVMQRQYRSQVVRDKSKYRRKSKHRKAPDFGGFSVAQQLVIPTHDSRDGGGTVKLEAKTEAGIQSYGTEQPVVHPVRSVASGLRQNDQRLAAVC